MKSYERGYEVTPLSYNTPPITIFEFIELNLFLLAKKRVQADKTKNTNQKTI